MNEKIFEYTLRNAWGMPLSQFSIFDRKQNAVEFFPNDDDRGAFAPPPDIMKAELEQSVIDRIKMILADDEIYAIEDLEDPSDIGIVVMDGVKNGFYFRSGDRVCELSTNNMGCCMDDLDRCPNLQKIISVCEEIMDIISEYDLGEGCFDADRA